MSDKEIEDPLKAIRESMTNTKSRSRASTKPIDNKEDTFMGQSIGAGQSPVPATVTATAAPPDAMLNMAPRRRKPKGTKKTEAVEIDPDELLKFKLSQMGKSEEKEEPPVAPKEEQIAAPEPEKPVSPKPKLGLLSPSPEPVKRSQSPVGAPSPVRAPSPVPFAQKTPTPTPAIQKTSSPVVPVEAPTPAKSPGVVPTRSPIQKIASEDMQRLADFDAVAEKWLPDTDHPTPEALSAFIAATQARSEQCDGLEQQLAAANSELEETKRALAAAPITNSDDATDALRQQLNASLDERDRLSMSIDELKALLTAKDAELAELHDTVKNAPPVLNVADIDELSEKMQERLKSTSDFIKEMEEFLHEQQEEIEQQAAEPAL